MTRGPLATRERVLLLALALAMALPGSVAGAGGSGGSGSVGGHVRASPILVTLSLWAASAPLGQSVRVEARVLNLGKTTLRSIAVELRADGSGLVIARPATEIGQLKAGRAAIVSWSVCGSAAGSYVLLARVTVDGLAIDSAARILTITVGGKRACR